jgi:muramoyltetrapeptide carboxypeptidase
MALTFNWERAPFVSRSLLNAFSGAVEIPAEAPLGNTMVDGIAEGKVVGGCLCLITDSLGTPDQVEFANNLLLVEDVDEAPHRVDAMLTHLINAGVAEQVAGFVFGEMSGSDRKVDEGIGGKPWADIVLERIKPLGKPAIVNYPFGHIKNMLSLPLGIRARLDAGAGSLKYLESHCR